MSLNVELLQNLSVIHVRAYLEAAGWQLKERFSDKGLIFTNVDETLKVLLPLKQEFSDYAIRVSEIVQALSMQEGRGIESILREMQLSGYDVFRIRLIGNAKGGTIPLLSTENVIEKARKILTAAASSVVRPRKVHSARKGKQVEEYMERVRLGQTEYGSYIFTLLSPVVPEIDTTLPLPFVEPIPRTQDPFERLVTNKLSDGINAAYNESIKILSGREASFEDKVDLGISAALCEGLGSITKSSGTAEFSVSWAKTRPHYIGVHPERYEFNMEMADIVEEVARVFKTTEPEDDLIIKGYVSDLSKDKMDPTGNVVVKGLVDGSLRPIRLILNDDEYAVAIKAHEGFKTISVEGSLISRGQFKVLEKVRNFRIDE